MNAGTPDPRDTTCLTMAEPLEDKPEVLSHQVVSLLSALCEH